MSVLLETYAPSGNRNDRPCEGCDRKVVLYRTSEDHFWCEDCLRKVASGPRVSPYPVLKGEKIVVSERTGYFRADADRDGIYVAPHLPIMTESELRTLLNSLRTLQIVRELDATQRPTVAKKEDAP